MVFTNGDVLDSIVPNSDFALGGEPNGLIVGPAAPAPFFRLSCESEQLALPKARVKAHHSVLCAGDKWRGGGRRR